MIYQNACDITAAANSLAADGRPVDPDDLATISPYITQTIRRFGDRPSRPLMISSPSVTATGWTAAVGRGSRSPHRHIGCSAYARVVQASVPTSPGQDDHGGASSDPRGESYPYRGT